MHLLMCFLMCPPSQPILHLPILCRIDIQRPITNNPIIIASIFITFFLAYPATALNRNPPPAEKRKSTGNSKVSTPYQCGHRILWSSESHLQSPFVCLVHSLPNGRFACNSLCSGLVVALIQKLQFHALTCCATVLLTWGANSANTYTAANIRIALVAWVKLIHPKTGTESSLSCGSPREWRISAWT